MIRRQRVVATSCALAISVALAFVFVSYPRAGQTTSSVVHGNGIIEAGEACDDGNVLDGDGCTAGGEIEQQCYDAGNVFSFFLWSDSYTSAGDGGADQIFNDVVDRTKYPGRVIPRFWLSTGDIPFMVDGTARLDEINNALSNSVDGQRYPFNCAASNGRYPYFVAIGNHDVDGYDGINGTTPAKQYNYWSTVVGPKLPTTLVGISNFRRGPDTTLTQYTTYSFDYKNAHFVIVNQYEGDPAYPTSDPNGCIRSQMYQWIDQDLAQTTKPIKFVFGHEPAWSYCSTVDGYGGQYCDALDKQTPAQRPRPYSTKGAWEEPYGRHWGDSLEAPQCPAGSREAFWSMLGRHNVVSHFVGHTHTYAGRLVQADGTRRNDVPAYGKTGQVFDNREGIWEVDAAQAHNSSGAAYVLVTVRDNVVSFESYDSIAAEPFRRIETWSVHVGSAPSSSIYGPADGAALIEGDTVPIRIDARDIDGSVSEVRLTANGALLATLTSAPYAFDWSNVAPGTYRLVASAVDNDNLTTASAPVTITVNPASGNQAPVLGHIGDQSATEMSQLAFQAVATDPDGNSITYSLVNAAPGAIIDPVSGVFTWTPTEAQGPGSFRFTVRARDNGVPSATADELITVTVAEVNSAPVVGVASTYSVNELSALAFTATATDADLPANALRFSLTGAPAGAAIDPLTGAFSWTPTEAQGPGTYAFFVTATDDGSPVAAGSKAVSVSVADVNQAPVLATISNKTAIQEQLLTFTASATDADLPANHLTFSLVGAPTGAAIDPNTGVFSWTPTLSQGGTFTFSVKVADDGAPSLSATRSLTVTVSAAPDLTISAVSTATTSLAPGGSFSASTTASNAGGANAGAFAIAFALSSDAVYGNGNDVALTGTRSVNSLAKGATSTASTTVTVPASTLPGTYYLCATADSNGAVSEINETNNARCSTATLSVGRPDLVMTDVTPQSSTVAAGAALAVVNTSANQGNSSAGSFTIAFRMSLNNVAGDADDIAVTATRSVSSLGVGAVSSATTTLTMPSTIAAGSYFVCAVADSASAVVENNESNNGLCSTSQVAVSLPNLRVSAISATPAAVARGGTLSVKNSIVNDGGSAAGSAAVAFVLSTDTQFGNADDVTLSATRSITSLNSGATSTATTSVSVPTAIALGNYYVCARADSGGAVAETDETDNASCTATAIQVAIADLVVSQVTPNVTSANSGTTLPVTETITNVGAVSGTKSTAAYVLSINSVVGDSDDVSINTTRSVPALAAGAASTATPSLTVPNSAPQGSYRVCVIADSKRVVAEAAEDNNTLCSTATVLIVRTNLRLSALSATPSPVTAGGAVTAANSVTNTGSVSAASSVVAFHLSQDASYGGADDVVLSATRTVSLLSGGATNTASTTLTVPAGLAAGLYYVCAQADAAGTVSEADESDNTSCTAQPIQVDSAPVAQQLSATGAATDARSLAADEVAREAVLSAGSIPAGSVGRRRLNS